MFNKSSIEPVAWLPASLPRRKFISSACAAAIALTAPHIHAQARVEKSKVQIALEGRATFHHLPLAIADQMGFFRAQGVDVEFVDVSNSAKARQAVASGAADLCAGAFEQVLHLHSKNQAVRAFVLQGRAPQCAFGVSTRLLSAKASPADFRGKKIGIPELGCASHFLAGTMLMRAGVKSADVSYVVLGSGVSAVNALRDGQVDALSYTEPVISTLEVKSEIRILSEARTVGGAKAVFGGTMPAACLYAPDEFLQKMPKTCQALANGVVQALKWLQTAGPSDLIKIVPESYFSNDRSIYLAAFDKLRDSISLDGLIPEDGPRTSLKVLTEFDGSIDIKKIDLQKTYTNELSLRAKERFKS